MLRGATIRRSWPSMGRDLLHWYLLSTILVRENRQTIINLVKTGAVNDEEGLGGRYWTRGELPHDLEYSG